MADLDRPVEFGGSVVPESADPTWPLRLTQTIEAAGLTFVGIQDHPYNSKFFDTWTLLATLAQATSRVRFFPDVANLPLRPPAMLAKAVASLDVLTQGRVELGLGAGAFWDGIAAMGGPNRRPGEAVTALEEAIQVIRLFWSGQTSIWYEGKHYSVKGVQPGPTPAHEVGIWLGAYGPRMLNLTGRLADGWVPSIGYAPPEQLPEMQQRINDAALAAGRQPKDIRRVYNLMGHIGKNLKRNRLDGPATQWIEELTHFVIELGMDTFIFWPTIEPMRQLEMFAAEVVPGVQEAVNRFRNNSAYKSFEGS